MVILVSNCKIHDSMKIWKNTKKVKKSQSPKIQLARNN